MDSSDIVIMPKPDSISWEEITELLHLAFASHLENGLNYAACTQTEEETRQRVGDGMCMVALINGELVGTATLNFYRGGGSSWASCCSSGFSEIWNREKIAGLYFGRCTK